MKSAKFLVPAIAAAFAFSTGAFAQQGESAPKLPPSTANKADVKAEAKKAGSAAKGECAPAATASTKSRADVKAETAAAKKAGTMPKGECAE